MVKPIFTFFNNKGGVGKTTLVFHVAHMFADMGWRVLAMDTDPQTNLTSAFLDEDQLEDIWPEDDAHPKTIYGAVRPLVDRTGDVGRAVPIPIDERLHLIAGDLALSRFEDLLSSEWPKALSRDAGAFRVLSSFWRLAQDGANQVGADLVLMDLGPNLGAINRTALISSDHVIIPLAPDLYSLQGLRNLGPTLRTWRAEWEDRLARKPGLEFGLPPGAMTPMGYVVMQHTERLKRPARAYERWMKKIPGEYVRSVLDQVRVPPPPTSDRHRLALLKHFRSLAPLAHEKRKPMFALTPADGAVGSHVQAVQRVEIAFRDLTKRIAQEAGLKSPK